MTIWLYSWNGDGRCLHVLVVSVDKRFKKYSTKMANTLIGLFAKGAVKLSPFMPRFPSRLIKEESALEEAMMTMGLLIIQRPLFIAYKFCTLTSCKKKKIPMCQYQTHRPSKRWMAVIANEGYLYPRGYFCCLGLMWRACVIAQLWRKKFKLKSELKKYPLTELTVTAEHSIASKQRSSNS